MTNPVIAELPWPHGAWRNWPQCSDPTADPERRDRPATGNRIISKRFLPRHSVRAGCNFERTILEGNPHQAKVDDQHVRGQREVWSFVEQRTLIVDMNALVLRSAERYITTPLIGDRSVVRHAPHDTEHLMVKEECWNKARWLERHWQKVAMGAAVRLVAVVLEVREENRPERVSACIDQGPREVFSEDAVAPVLDLGDLVVNHPTQTSAHSCRSTLTGSTRDARTAGTTPAQTPAKSITKRAPPTIAGSVALTPMRLAVVSRDATSAAGSPMVNPAAMPYDCQGTGKRPLRDRHLDVIAGQI